jgi:type IV pilus assembly protein PilA
LIAQVNKGKQAEARQNVGALNRAQQAYYLENSAFSSDIVQVGIGISTQTVNYTYTISVDDAANPQTVANIGSRVKDPGTLKSYRGLNFTTIGGVGASTEVLALSRLCETETPNNSTGTVPAGQTSCESGFKDLGAK